MGRNVSVDMYRVVGEADLVKVKKCRTERNSAAADTERGRGSGGEKRTCLRTLLHIQRWQSRRGRGDWSEPAIVANGRGKSYGSCAISKTSCA